MSSFILVPLVFWECPLSQVVTTSGTSGSIFNAINSPPLDYLGMSAGGELDIKGGGSFAVPSSLAASESAVFVKLADDVLTDSPPDYWYYEFYTGASVGSLSQQALSAVYGNSRPSGDKSIFGTDAVVSGSVDGYALAVTVYDDQYVDAYQRIVITTGGTPASSPQIYEFMMGHVLALPDGFARRERNVQRTHYGGKVGTTRFGNPTWSGLFSAKPRNKFDLEMRSLRSSERDKWRDVFRYGRGTFPVLFVEDSDDVATWGKYKMTRLQEVEMAGEYDITLEFEQV